MKKKFMLGLAFGTLLVSFTALVAPSMGNPGGLAALQKAAKENKHLFVFLYEKDDARTRSIRKTFEADMIPVAASCNWIALDKKAEKGLVEKYRLSDLPTPFVFAVAPNGAVTGRFRKWTPDRIKRSIATPVRQRCLKALQDNKLVFLCIQGPTTLKNEEALLGVSELRADPQSASLTEAVTLDPADPTEESFLKRLMIDTRSKEALTVLVASSGSQIATFRGATTKKDLLAALEKAAGNASKK
ncbi:MAG TPA: hypothetical protein DD435_07460 [Cyanobacteria bacterium UBA8530]|nr:hypothetical protein [Cyanobacteria bacterium UBA8530]